MIAATMLPRPLHAAHLPGPKYQIARRFNAFWNGQPIGSHAFTLKPTGDPGDYDVAVDIDIRVDIGVFGEIVYRHTSREAWRAGHVVSLESWTNDDGERFAVTGVAVGEDFRMIGPTGPFLAPGDLLTSNSAWSEAICRESMIIDATAGELVGLVASLHRTDYAFVEGETHRARVYRVISPIIAGSFWYDENGIWMRGELLRSGERIDYVLAA